MPTIFSPAISVQRTAALDGQLQSPRKKRKRLNATQNVDQELEQDMLQKTSKNPIELEYTAVVSPLERLQRRVAGQPLDQSPPPFPFPHAGRAATAGGTDDEQLNTGSLSSMRSNNVPLTLHLQHLAALTAIVHRSLLTEDFTRAARALGLMFREDSVNRHVAVRSQGYMGIAAEVLLRQGCSRQGSAAEVSPAGLLFTREGFENAKRFYERLIIRHPYHKSWPGSVNAVDFYLAMFNLWIYVTHAENSGSAADVHECDGITHSPSSSPRSDSPHFGSRAKVREIEQANEIASRMDTCMATLPYMDEPELIRLRAMVALWIADLHDDVGSMQTTLDPDAFSGRSNELDAETSRSEHAREASRARDFARDLVERLAGGPRHDE